jgi:hypothetical protein
MSTRYCRHVRANGARCRSLALGGETTCYWHHDLRRRHRNLVITTEDLPASIPANHRNIALLQREPSLATYYGVNLSGPFSLNLPPLEDRDSIQLALSLILSALGTNRLETKRAAVLLYGLQVASSNARDLDHAPARVVCETVIDERGNTLSADEDPEETPDLVNELLQEATQ